MNIYLFDTKKYNIWFAGGKLMTVKDWCISEGADLCFNLGYFTFSTGQPDTFIKDKYGHPFGKDKYSDVINLGVTEAYGYSNAIKNGVVSVQYPRRDSAVRNGIGLTESGKVIVAQTDRAMSEVTFANNVNAFVKKRGEKVKIFVLEDGGGSVSEYSNASRLSFYPKGTRKVATVTCIQRKRPHEQITRTLQKGRKGEDVVLLQTLLGGIEADGIFGKGTRTRVIAMQKATGLYPDGIAGHMTLTKLGTR